MYTCTVHIDMYFSASSIRLTESIFVNVKPIKGRDFPEKPFSVLRGWGVVRWSSPQSR